MDPFARSARPDERNQPAPGTSASPPEKVTPPRRRRGFTGPCGESPPPQASIVSGLAQQRQRGSCSLETTSRARPPVKVPMDS